MSLLRQDSGGQGAENAAGLPAVASREGWFFDDPARVALLIAEAESWRNTPFRFGSREKGIDGGTDCVGLCEAVMVAAGAVEQFNFPRTPADNSRHVHNDKILNYLRGSARASRAESGASPDDIDPQSLLLAERFAELDVSEANATNSPFTDHHSLFIAGDLALLKTGKGLWHMCIMLNSTAFMQCAWPDGVTEGDISAPNYRKYLVAAFRAKALSRRSPLVSSVALAKADGEGGSPP